MGGCDWQRQGGCTCLYWCLSRGEWRCPARAAAATVPVAVPTNPVSVVLPGHPVCCPGCRAGGAAAALEAGRERQQRKWQQAGGRQEHGSSSCSAASGGFGSQELRGVGGRRCRVGGLECRPRSSSSPQQAGSSSSSSGAQAAAGGSSTSGGRRQRHGGGPSEACCWQRWWHEAGSRQAGGCQAAGGRFFRVVTLWLHTRTAPCAG